MADVDKNGPLINEDLNKTPTESLRKRSWESSPSPTLKKGSEELNDSTQTVSPGSTCSNTSTSGLRSEEAELAAVIAKVTGRASPFVNELDDGKRKFTIICGEDANVGAINAEGASSYASKIPRRSNYSPPLSILSPTSLIQSEPQMNIDENYTKPRIVGYTLKKKKTGAGNVVKERVNSENDNEQPKKEQKHTMHKVHSASYIYNKKLDEVDINMEQSIPATKEMANSKAEEKTNEPSSDNNEAVSTDVLDAANIDDDHVSMEVDANVVNSTESKTAEVHNEGLKESKIDNINKKDYTENVTKGNSIETIKKDNNNDNNEIINEDNKTETIDKEKEEVETIDKDKKDKVETTDKDKKDEAETIEKDKEEKTETIDKDKEDKVETTDNDKKDKTETIDNDKKDEAETTDNDKTVTMKMDTKSEINTKNKIENLNNNNDTTENINNNNNDNTEKINSKKTETSTSEIGEEEKANFENSVIDDQSREKRDENALQSDTVKACFPSTNSAITPKHFDSATEMQQNILNRRMAARNATAIAQLDPLVNVSPEAQKLAMWSSGKPIKNSTYDPDESVMRMSSASEILVKTEDEGKASDELPLESIQVYAYSNGSFVANEDQETEAEMQDNLSTPSEDDQPAKGVSGNDGERGDDHCLKQVSLLRNKHFMISGLLMIVISIAVVVALITTSFSPHLFNSHSDKRPHELSPGQHEGLVDPYQEDDYNENVLGRNFMVLPEEEDEDYIEENDFDHLEDKEDKILNPLFAEDNSMAVKSKSIQQWVCNSLEPEDVVVCERINPLVLKLIFKSILLCQETGDIILPGYIEMYKYLNSFLSSFGGFAAVQTKMLEERLNQLEVYVLGDHRFEYQTVFKMIYFEVSTGTIASTDPFSGTILFACLHRHLQYLTLALENVLALHPDQSLKIAFDIAYEKVLASHHNWIVKSIYDIGMHILPTKNQATLMLGIRQVEKVMIEELEDSLGLVISKLNVLNDIVERLLNHTDVFAVIPVEVIT